MWERMFLMAGGTIYMVRYSPATIFSGTVPGLQVNFINPDANKNATSATTSKPTLTEVSGGAGMSLSNLKSQYGYNPDMNPPYQTGNLTNQHLVAAWMNGTTQYYADMKDFSIDFEGRQVTIDNYMQDPNSTILYLYTVQTAQSGVTKVSIAKQLQPVVATWYVTLRAIALVGLLSVLVYIGIRILLTSIAEDKAKYKKMLTDWAVALCLLFVLQYVMAFTLTIVQDVSGLFTPELFGSGGQDILMTNIRSNVGNVAQTADFGQIFFNMLMYLILVIYTVIFTVVYLKRVVYMAFFTIIAPLIALTYPIDKIKDGQAQAFSLWLKEYIFNALLQVIHLLLYFIFVGSAMELVNQNPLYAIICIGFLVPAEKFLKNMFGFNKASTVGEFGAAAGGALVMNAINKARNLGDKDKQDRATAARTSGGPNQQLPWTGRRGSAEAGGGRWRPAEAGGGRRRLAEVGGGWRRSAEAGGGRRRLRRGLQAKARLRRRLCSTCKWKIYYKSRLEKNC